MTTIAVMQPYFVHFAGFRHLTYPRTVLAQADRAEKRAINPGRMLRYRFAPERIEILNGFGWWNFEFDTLREIEDVFKCDVTRLSAAKLEELFSTT